MVLYDCLKHVDYKLEKHCYPVQICNVLKHYKKQLFCFYNNYFVSKILMFFQIVNFVMSKHLHDLFNWLKTFKLTLLCTYL